MVVKKHLNFEAEQGQDYAIAERMELQFYKLKYQKCNPLEEVEEILTLLAFYLDLSVDDVSYLLRRMANEKNRQVDRKGQNRILLTESAQIIQAIFANLNSNWHSFVTTRLRLIDLPDEVKKALRQGKIEYTKALKIGTVKDNKLRYEILRSCIRNRWSLSKLKTEIHQAQLVQNFNHT